MEPQLRRTRGLLPRDGEADDVRWCDVDLCYVFHPLNAYDLPDGGVVLDVVRHPKMFDTDKLGPNDGTSTLEAWTVDPSAGKVLEERLDDRGEEFPRVDERVIGLPHRYGYAAKVGSGFAHGPLLKHDLEAGITSVPIVYDAQSDSSDLVILDAQDFTGPPVASVRLPQRVPFGFHGNWVPE